MASFVEYLKLKDLIATLVTIKIQHDVKNLRHSNSNTQPITDHLNRSYKVTDRAAISVKPNVFQNVNDCLFCFPLSSL
jgi:hypothetical protein